MSKRTGNSATYPPLKLGHDGNPGPISLPSSRSSCPCRSQQPSPHTAAILILPPAPPRRVAWPLAQHDPSFSNRSGFLSPMKTRDGIPRHYRDAGKHSSECRRGIALETSAFVSRASAASTRNDLLVRGTSFGVVVASRLHGCRPFSRVFLCFLWLTAAHGSVKRWPDPYPATRQPLPTYTMFFTSFAQLGLGAYCRPVMLVEVHWIRPRPPILLPGSISSFVDGDAGPQAKRGFHPCRFSGIHRNSSRSRSSRDEPCFAGPIGYQVGSPAIFDGKRFLREGDCHREDSLQPTCFPRLRSGGAVFRGTGYLKSLTTSPALPAASRRLLCFHCPSNLCAIDGFPFQNANCFRP